MCCKIPREQLIAEQQLANYKIAQYILEETDGGRTLIRALVDMMEGNEPGTMPHHRLAAAQELIGRGRFIPGAADHIKAAENIIAGYANDEE